MNNLREGFLDDWFVVDCCYGQPEGTLEEWRQIIAAMKAGKSCQAGRRVGLRVINGFFELYSPRNSIDDGDGVLLASSDLPEWISAAEALLKQHAQEVEMGEGI